MVLNKSMSLLPCGSTRRPSHASNQDVQRGMARNNGGPESTVYYQLSKSGGFRFVDKADSLTAM